MIERATARLAGWIKDPTPQRESELGRAIEAAVQLRSGRDDGLARREDHIDVLFDVIETLRSSVKAHLIKTLPAKLGSDPDDVERALDIEMASLVRREELEAIIDAQLAGKT
jgi:hypothetical protein